jgi:transcriptional regulator with XRE-family HTH domain
MQNSRTSESDRNDLYEMAQRLKGTRERKGISQTETARYLGINKVSLSQAEAGTRRFFPGEITRLTRLYDVSLSSIMGGDAWTLRPLLQTIYRTTEMLRRLREAREKVGITQAEAAGILGMREEWFSEAEIGKREFCAGEIVLLSRAYNVSISSISEDEVSSRHSLVQYIFNELTKLPTEAISRLFACITSTKDLSNPLLHVFKHALIARVRTPTLDLNTRQTAVLLKFYLDTHDDTPETTLVEFAKELNIPYTGLQQALERLEACGLIKRLKDPDNRRTTSITGTNHGIAYLQALSDCLDDASHNFLLMTLPPEVDGVV